LLDLFMEEALNNGDFEVDSNFTDCTYFGTEHVEVKIYMIGVFATFIAILSIIFNTFFTLVFLTNASIRKSSVFYFGILAVIDTIMAVNYIAVMSIPVYMDYYHFLPIYHLFLSYFRIVLTESNCAMFSSMLLIVLATTERLLRTFHGAAILKARSRVFRMDEGTLTTIHYSQYEIIPGPLTVYPNYRFWWMFITRNALDRILPFFVLVAMNYLIIKALKKEYVRQGFEPQPSIRQKNPNVRVQRGSLRVVLTFWETFDRASLESESLNIIYSYMNDIVSILTLLSRLAPVFETTLISSSTEINIPLFSCLRFPVYCSCNRLIYSASSTTLSEFKNVCFKQKKAAQEYAPITSHRRSPPIAEIQTYLYNPTEPVGQSVPEIARVTGAIYDDVLKEWKL
uniref:G_PROTEIN_RECEP_F1_2 domain-containing protein n=1 Tax=Heligmosomoides polygyrus TaxID=6339 RepID=A0A8L8KI86_HELPZ